MKLLIVQCSPPTSSVTRPDFLLRTLYSDILNLCSYLSLRDQVSHTYKTTYKIIVFYIIICKFLERRHKDRF